MKKITEIETTKYRTTHDKDENGNRIKKRVPYKGFRKVRTIVGGQRFAHYFIDGVIYSFLLYPVDKLMAAIGFGVETVGYAILVSFFPIFIAYPLYYFLFEHFTQSTPGKMLLKRKVINEYGNKPNPQELIVRSLVRIVPFEPFTCVDDRGWHDRWSKTFVVDQQELEKLQSLLTEEEKASS